MSDYILKCDGNKIGKTKSFEYKKTFCIHIEKRYIPDKYIKKGSFVDDSGKEWNITDVTENHLFIEEAE